MIDLRLKHKGDGVFHAATAIDIRLANEKIEVDRWLRAKVTQPRSGKMDRFFFALVKQIYNNLPHGHNGHDFKSVDHFRYHLLVQAGHCNELELDLEVLEEKTLRIIIDQVINRFLADEERVFFSKSGTTLFVRTAKTINHVVVDGGEFVPVAKHALDIGAEMIGVTVEDLKEEYKRLNERAA